MEEDAAVATLIRGLLTLEAMVCERLRESRRQDIAQVEVHKVAEKAQKQAMIAQIEVKCG